MKDYFRTVTLGAFTWRNEERIALLFDHIRKIKPRWLILHFLLLTICIDFPVTFAIARLAPVEMYRRLYGENNMEGLNMVLANDNFDRIVQLPWLGMAFCLILIIQAVFYLCAVFFLGLSRLHSSPLPFSDRLGLTLFSSTLPALAAALFGFYLPTVHIIVFYFMVMFFMFQRSSHYKE
ncbi:MAG: hypothetical protein LBB72_04145 [Spirochaetaceae bacterium]|jgi:hypothetical protein|nr:hypothetical protein [Spirochaetaceae bacterium]